MSMGAKVITIVGLVFAIVFVVLMAVSMGVITDKGNSANSQLVDTINITSGVDLGTMNESEVTGNIVVNTLKNAQSDSGNGKLVYIVTTTAGGNSGTTKYYGYGKQGSDIKFLLSDGKTEYTGDGTGVTGYNSTTDATLYSSTSANKFDSNYINESASFWCNVLYSRNGLPVGVHFIQTTVKDFEHEAA